MSASICRVVLDEVLPQSGMLRATAKSNSAGRSLLRCSQWSTKIGWK